LDFLDTLSGQAAIAVESAQLFQNLQLSNAELVEAYDATLEGWAKALELRDKETEGHSKRVTEMSLKLAKALGVDRREMIHLRRGALLHDIGKMGMPDSILLKPGPLSEEEWEVMRLHPVYAKDMLSTISFLRPALEIPYYHHEKWDGSGYPLGLSGEEIPLAARIFAVVDVWDALGSDRPYRTAWSREEIFAYIKEQSAKHFDPRIVETFVTILMQDAEANS
jgi:putative nucleotidyltransferase with HDIG domain